MKNYFFFLALFASYYLHGQEITRGVSPGSNFLQNSQTTTMIDYFKKNGYSNPGAISEGTLGIKADPKSKSDKYNITIETFKMTDKKGKEVYITRILDNITKEAIIFSETEDKVFELKNNTVQQQSNVTQKAFSDCLASYLKPGVTACAAGKKCIDNNRNTCGAKKKRYQKIACYVDKCNSSLFPCIKNIALFLWCLVN